MALKLIAMVGVFIFSRVRTACDRARRDHDAGATVLAILRIG
jgi:hypothetical protein